MQLTQFTDYSLRSLIYIATHPKGCRIADIAKAYGISQHHLTKIIHHLAKLKVIHTVRGKNGGIHLAVDPHAVNLKSLVLQLEPHFDLVPCFNVQKQNCCIAPACYLKKVLSDGQQAFFAVLNQYTLADILGNADELRRLL